MPRRIFSVLGLTANAIAYVIRRTVKPNVSRYSKLFVVYAAIAAVSGTGCSGCHKKHGGAAGSALAELPPNAIGAMYLNVGRLRAQPSVQRLRTMLAANPQASAALAMVRADCGFDPLDRLDSIVVGMTNTQPFGEDALVIARGTATAAEITHCLTTSIPHMSHHQLTQAGTAGTHALYNEVDPMAAAMPGHERPQYAILDNGVLIAKPGSMQADLNALDHPPSSSNSPLDQAAHMVTGDAAMLLVADFTAIKTALPASAQPDFGSGIPGASAEVMQNLWRSAQAGVFAITFAPSGFHFNISARFATPQDAHLTASLLTSAYAMGRAAMQQNPVFANPAMLAIGADPATQTAMTQAATTLTTVLGRVQIHDEGNVAKVDLDLSQQEIDALTNGAEAAFRMYQQRMQSIQNQMGAPPSGLGGTMPPGGMMAPPGGMMAPQR